MIFEYILEDVELQIEEIPLVTSKNPVNNPVTKLAGTKSTINNCQKLIEIGKSVTIVAKPNSRYVI